MKKTTYFGNSWIGLFVKSNQTHSIVPVDAMDKLVHSIEANLKTEVVKMLVGNTNLIGLYVAMNSTGAILPNTASDEEVTAIRKLGLNVYRSNEKNNAHGNNLVVNDKGGFINPIIDKHEKKKIEDVLGVELLEASIARYPTVGSCVIANNRGFLTHFKADDAEIKLLENALKVKGTKGSINMGTGFVSLGVTANENGYVVGEQTSAFEMGRIEEALGFL